MPIIISGLVILFLLLILAFFITLKAEINQKNSVFGGLDTVLFLVTMPKNPTKKEEDIAKEEKVIISQMEQVLSNFLYLKKAKIFQPTPSITLEIASQIGGSDIMFYVAVPKYLESVFEKYVQGVYPNAVVDKVPEDYTVFEPQGETAGAYLKLTDNFLFPISTYKTLDKDPLSLLTNNLSKITANEGAAMQVILRPLSKLNLRNVGEKALKKIREGESIKSAIAGSSKGMIAQEISEMGKIINFHPIFARAQIFIFLLLQFLICNALSAAASSASCLEEPSPSATSSSPRNTPTKNSFSWSGPVSFITRYAGVVETRS